MTNKALCCVNKFLHDVHSQDSLSSHRRISEPKALTPPLIVFGYGVVLGKVEGGSTYGQRHKFYFFFVDQIHWRRLS